MTRIFTIKDGQTPAKEPLDEVRPAAKREIQFDEDAPELSPAMFKAFQCSVVQRNRRKKSSIDAGVIWLDVFTDLERTSDHCSNIAGCVMDIAHQNMKIHESLREFRNESEGFHRQFKAYTDKYMGLGSFA